MRIILKNYLQIPLSIDYEVKSRPNPFINNQCKKAVNEIRKLGNRYMFSKIIRFSNHLVNSLGFHIHETCDFSSQNEKKKFESSHKHKPLKLPT